MRYLIHNLPVSVLGLFGWTLAFLALPHFVLGAWYGSMPQLMGTVAVMLCCVPQVLLARRLGPVTNEVFIHSLNLLALTIAQATMTDGHGGAVLFIAFSLSSVTFSSRNWLAGIALFVGAIVLFVVPASAITATSVPGRWSVLASLVFFGILAVYFVKLARRKADRAWQRIDEAEADLHEQAQAVKRQNLDLEQANALLDADAQALSELLGSTAQKTQSLAKKRLDEESLVQAIHHDLREPLRSIVSFNQLIRRRLNREEQSQASIEYLDFAEDAGLRMVKMLDDLLTYTRTDATEQQEHVALDEVVAAAQANLHNLFERTGAILTTSKLPVVQGYHTQLVQLFQNLFANALKFARPGVPPRLSVNCRKLPDHSFEVQVSDNGCGIAPSKLTAIFSLFNRAGRDDSSEGSGVGLALCRRIATTHSAELSVTSVQGTGTTFQIVFPEFISVAATASPTVTPTHQPS